MRRKKVVSCDPTGPDRAELDDDDSRLLEGQPQAQSAASAAASHSRRRWKRL